ncbi:MFS transporter [Nocardioides speluncae]|uniref:MFS transporter n=1 Tax=Nocardioides speluncae TaxID=2670337 RepID=UPI000D68D601|nr:MFS transporter [Nocardioides speluncae]
MTRRTPLFGWLVADVASLTGTRVSMIAIPWFVLTTTGSATQTGLVAAAEMAPLVLMKALGGPIIDRLGARRVTLTCDALSTIVVGLIPLLHLAGLLGFPVLLMLVALAGALRGPGDASKYALVPQIAEMAGVPLERVTGLQGAIERTAAFAGAAFAGVLVALVGPANALLVDAASFAVSGVALAATTRGLGRPERTVQSDSSYVTDLREGWRFLRSDPVLVGICLMVSVTNLLDQAYTVVLVPVWAHDSGRGAAAVGVLFAVFSAASIGGSVLAAAFAERLPRFRVYVVAFLLCGAPRFVALALDSPMWLILGTAVVGGFASGFLNPVLGAVIYERITPHLTGRVTSLNTALCWSLMPLGGLLGGALIAGVGLSPALLLVGAAYFVATMAPTAGPRFRAMDRPPPTRPVLTPEHADPALVDA